MQDVIPSKENTMAQKPIKKRRIKPLTLRISERRLVLLTVDLIILNVTLFIVMVVRGKLGFSFQITLREVLWFVTLSTIWIVNSFFFNVYDLVRTRRLLQAAYDVALAGLLTFAIYLFIPFLPPPIPTGRFFILLQPLVSVSILVLWRLFYALIPWQSPLTLPVLVVGAGKAGKTLASALNDGVLLQGEHYEIVGFIDDNAAKEGMAISDSHVIGSSGELVSLAATLRPVELIIAVTDSQKLNPTMFQAILDCREMGIPISMMPAVYERVTGRVAVGHIGQDLYAILPVEKPVGHRIYRGLSRSIDLAVALIGCLVIALTIPVVWLLNRFFSPGELFFRQERVGGGGKPFEILKFRSMVMNAEKETGAVWATEDDPRITKLGNFLRKSRLDEIPQFWNVLKGDMRLIGPRPERPHFVAQLEQELPFYRLRHAVKPGITGWAQVMYRYAASAEDALIKLQFDLYYIKNESLYLDLLILLKTIKVVLNLRGR